MNQKTFAQELARLTAIPVAKAAEARATAGYLSDEDRAAFFTRLVAINDELQSAAQEELKALEAFELSLMGLEKHVRRSVRSETEAGERRHASTKAEEKLKKYS